MKDYREVFERNPYAFRGEDSVLDDKDLGICADRASVLTPECSVTALRCLQGCPYTNTGFTLDVVIDGERFKSKEWIWLPNAILRSGSHGDWVVESLTVVVPGTRTVIERISVTNLSENDKSVPVQIMYRGCTRREERWEFGYPSPGDWRKADYNTEDDMLTASSDGYAYVLTSSLEGMTAFRLAYLWENELSVKARESAVIYVSAHIGSISDARKEAAETKRTYEELIGRSFTWLDEKCRWLSDALPHLSSDNAKLDALYYRSLVTYILCRWEIPELCMSPYYSTGSVNGACMCSYLWDYSGGLMLHPLADPETNKAEIKAFLKNDLTKCYAINPISGAAVGPWYQINQEKVIRMIYYQVLLTGGRDFLFEEAGERSVIDWVIHHAYVCDDLSKPAGLYDYGKGGNAHLELRRGIPYNGIMPDLNARRYMNYTMAYELSVIAGKPEPRLIQRAEDIKSALKQLWNKDANWYDFISDGKRDIRYTVQMFKFLNSPVISDDERKALITHLNEREFLSKFGLHSMSKTDIAYDQDDIDNGGGGICTLFTMQICSQLYETGYDALATDILERVLWWGQRLPYLGDSCAANMIMNRYDTPLQGDLSSVSCAQLIVFHLFGIHPAFDGTVMISPVKIRPAKHMQLDSIKLCGKTFSIDINGGNFTVTCADKVYESSIGDPVTLA